MLDRAQWFLGWYVDRTFGSVKSASGSSRARWQRPYKQHKLTVVELLKKFKRRSTTLPQGTAEA
jgi:hypothetical protein